jgi:hypothetical protein
MERRRHFLPGDKAAPYFAIIYNFFVDRFVAGFTVGAVK